MEEERDQLTQARSLALVVPPKAQQLDKGSKSVLLYMLGPILGIIIAFCFSLLAEALDHTLRTPVEVEKYLGKPVLAVLPRIRPEREGRKQLSGASNPSITS
jgi:capsular polysaccharide biosynthesis protein